jgi:ubiquinone/menaquinone biosynthesis C-methylase UbiE
VCGHHWFTAQIEPDAMGCPCYVESPKQQQGILMFVKFPDHVDSRLLLDAAERLESKLHAKLPELQSRLGALKTDGEPPGYWGEWIGRKMGNVLSYLQIYAYIIGQAIPPNTRLEDVRMLDYGGGWGLLGLLAKEAGVGSVTYLDIHQGIAQAVRITSETLELPLANIIGGDETHLSGRFNSVVSSDVLEHVYKPERVFAEIARVCEPGAHVFHQTGANPKSLHQRVTLSRLHREEEAKIIRQRADIIAARIGPNPALAAATRGLDRADLEAAIERFKSTGVMPVPDHPTNTCELSGYWLERLMDPYEVAAKMSRAGFSAEVRQSFWGPGRSSLPSRLMKHALNAVSAISVPIGLRATFYYCIHGVRRDSP